MSTCENCGAANDGESVVCRFCKQPYSQELLASALRCPQCASPNLKGRPKCAACGASLELACVFCGARSPCDAVRCGSCDELFAGAEERKQARQLGEIVDTVGSLLGVATGHAPRDDSPRHASSDRSDRDRGGGGGAPPMES